MYRFNDRISFVIKNFYMKKRINHLIMFFCELRLLAHAKIWNPLIEIEGIIIFNANISWRTSHRSSHCKELFSSQMIFLAIEYFDRFDTLFTFPDANHWQLLNSVFFSCLNISLFFIFLLSIWTFAQSSRFFF